jgi:hypothetical protein
MKNVLKLGALSAVALASVQSAMAALPAGVTTGITTAQADLIEMYGALTAAGIAIFVVAVVYRHFRVK